MTRWQPQPSTAIARPWFGMSIESGTPVGRSHGIYVIEEANQHRNPGRWRR